jgi:hypothetical protein
MAGKIIFLTVVVFVLLITGCGGDKPSSAFSGRGGSVVVTEYSPAEPTSSDAITLKITAIGGETPEYNWVVNGMSVSVRGNKLSPEHFSKNDTVFCSILIGREEKKKVGPIVIKNSPPRINSVEISPGSPQHGTDLSLDANVSDVDGDDVVLRARWFINEEEVSMGEVLSGSKIKAADKVYALVTPFDATNEGLPFNSGWILVQNSPPEFVSPSPSIEGRTMNYEVEVKDGDGDNIDLSLEQGPNGMRFEGNRLVWEAPEIDKDTSFLVEIKARDERGGETSVSFSLDVRKREMQ